MADNGDKTNNLTKIAIDFLMGGASAAVSKTAFGTPLEVIKINYPFIASKIRYQTPEKTYIGILDIAKKIVADEGVKALWKGNGINVIRYSPTQALNFSLKDYFKRLFGKSREKKDGFLVWFLRNFALGGAAGSISLLFIYSLDYTRTKLFNDLRSSRPRKYSGLIDVYKQTLSAEGISGLYRGFVISCFSIVIYRGLYFGIYDSVKPILPSNFRDNLIINFALGLGATFLSYLASFPLDTIRKIMMMASRQDKKYSGSLDCFQKTVANYGVKFLFKGVTSRGVVIGACVLTLYDRLQLIVFGKQIGAEEG